MELLIFLLLAFAALVAACPPPLNDFYYLGNETHTTEDLLLDLRRGNMQIGWDEVVTKA
jgi:hypothetical protein